MVFPIIIAKEKWRIQLGGCSEENESGPAAENPSASEKVENAKKELKATVLRSHVSSA